MKAKSTTSAKPAANVSHAKNKGPELPVISTVKLVPIALIDIEAQVRTVFDDESIQELADDIGARGLLQPVLLNPHGARFTLIAGERRIRACKLLQLSDVPALITKASSGDVLLMQLAENIQRENLDLQDEVKAIRQMHDVLGTVKAVAEAVKKSPPWVSKRLSLSHPDLNYSARQLLEDGITEDIEILNIVASLYGISWKQGQELADKLRKGEATRDSARAMLATAKAAQPTGATLKTTITGTPAEIEAEQKRQNADWKRQQEDARKEREEGTGEKFITWAWMKLEQACRDIDGDEEFAAVKFFNALHHNQRVAIRRFVAKQETDYQAFNLQQWAVKLDYENVPMGDELGYLESLIAVATLKGQKVSENLPEFLTVIEQANREAQK